MKRSVQILVLCIACGFIACKKNNASSNNPSSGYNNPTFNGYYGILTVLGQQSVNGSILTPSNPYAGSLAYFASVPKFSEDASSYVKVNKVSLDGVFFAFAGYEYADSTSAPLSYPYLWNVLGMGSIPTFTFSNTNAMPSFSGFSNLPDSISKQQPLTIPLLGVTGADSIRVTIEDFATHRVVQSVGANITSVNFSTSALGQIDVGNNAVIVVRCLKDNVQVINGKPFNFPIIYQLSKTISVKQ